MTAFTTIRIVSVDTGGANYEVMGTWNNKPYRVAVWCEFDGRDVEVEPLIQGEHDPTSDWNDAPDFFTALCEHKRFIHLHNQAYKAWEAMPTNDD